MRNTTSSVNVEKRSWPHVAETTGANLNGETLLSLHAGVSLQ